MKPRQLHCWPPDNDRWRARMRVSAPLFLLSAALPRVAHCLTGVVCAILECLYWCDAQSHQ